MNLSNFHCTTYTSTHSAECKQQYGAYGNRAKLKQVRPLTAEPVRIERAESMAGTRAFWFLTVHPQPAVFKLS